MPSGKPFLHRQRKKAHDVRPISQRPGVRVASEQEETRSPTACTHLKVGKVGNYPGYGALRLHRTEHTWKLWTTSSSALKKAAQNGCRREPCQVARSTTCS